MIALLSYCTIHILCVLDSDIHFSDLSEEEYTKLWKCVRRLSEYESGNEWNGMEWNINHAAQKCWSEKWHLCAGLCKPIPIRVTHCIHVYPMKIYFAYSFESCQWKFVCAYHTNTHTRHPWTDLFLPFHSLIAAISFHITNLRKKLLSLMPLLDPLLYCYCCRRSHWLVSCSINSLFTHIWEIQHRSSTHCCVSYSDKKARYFRATRKLEYTMMKQYPQPHAFTRNK